MVMRYVTASEMKEIDRITIEERGIPAERLMENAGKALADETMKMLKSGRITVLAGYGNNGGDGLVAARYLLNKSYKVSVVFVGKPKSFTPESNSNLERLLSMGSTPSSIFSKVDSERIFSGGKPDIIIDAIFGIGIKGGLDEFYTTIIDRINSSGVPIVSADIPSGLDADTGKPLGAAVKAVKTVTFGYPKSGFKGPEAGQYIGELIIADIGLNDEIARNDGDGTFTANMISHKAVRLRSGRKGIIKPGHPWIYKSQILKPDAGIGPGDIISVSMSDGSFVGRGYYNPASEIVVRLLTFNDEAVDEALLRKKIQEAIAKRDSLSEITNARRLVFSEADGLPGLIVDEYDETIVFQVFTLGMERLKESVLKIITELLKPRCIYEKSDSPFRKIEGLKTIKRWLTDEGVSNIEIFEGRAKFIVDIENGHKTGFYLDQRRSRIALKELSKDKTVLDLFCYTGGFSIAAALGGAKKITGVDIKKRWLELARKNAQLNGVSDRADYGEGDVFGVLKNIYNAKEKFDIIVLDPPSFVRDKASVAAAAKGYKELNTLAMASLTEGGILCTFSCSYNMTNDIFSDVIKRSAESARKSYTILKRCRQDKDHPIVKAIPQTEYLKGYFLKIESKQ